RTSWLASTLATLLAMPHMLWYDWVLLLPAAFALVLGRPSRTLIALLVLLHLSVNLSTLELENSSLLSFAVFVATPAAMALLVYLAFQERIELLLSRWLAGTGPLEAPSPAGRGLGEGNFKRWLDLD